MRNCAGFANEGTELWQYREKGMGGRFWRYVRKTFALHQQLSAVPESREKPRIAARDCLLFALLLFLSRRKSLLGAEQVLKNQKSCQKVFPQGVPSDTTVGRIFARMDLSWLRHQLWDTYYQAIRKKMLDGCRIAHFWVIAYDGHETISSFAHCCKECRQREIKCKDVTGQMIKRTQYYHSYSAASLVGSAGPQGIFDLEPILSGENEVAATIRLMQRTAAHFPAFHSIGTLDAIYLQAPFINQCLQAAQHVLAVLKGNCPELRDEVFRLALSQPPVIVFTQKNTTISLYEVTDLWLWKKELAWPLRGVIAEEITQETYYEAGKPKIRTVKSIWSWVTTLRPHEATALDIWQIGHHRWKIENRGFNVTPKDMGINHCFKHDPTALLAFLLVLFWAQFLLACFYLRNLKPIVRNRLNEKNLVALFAADLLEALPEILLPNPP